MFAYFYADELHPWKTVVLARFEQFARFDPANTRKNAQVVTNLQQTCSNACSNNLSSGFFRTACSQLVDKLSTAC
jgi:hypothetical protein